MPPPWLTTARPWLARQRLADGAFPYVSGNSGRGEPTLLAVAAGQPVPGEWLSTAELTWEAYLVPAVVWHHDRALAERYIERILTEKGHRTDSLENEWFDTDLVGWPWRQGAFSWVVPTAHALISLAVAGIDHPRRDQGLLLLRDRQGSDGGWNYGNPGVLDKELPSHVAETGWALLALPVDDPSAAAGLDYLDVALERPAVMSLALALLALAAHDRPTEEHARALLARLADWPPARVDLVALAVLALTAHEGGTVAFRP